MKPQVSLNKTIREMDADELEAKAAEMLSAPLTNADIQVLEKIKMLYRQLTGSEMIIETIPQLAS